MEMSQTVGELALALSKAQAKFPKLIRDKEVSIRGGRANFFFKYAELEQVISKTKEILAENELAVSQLLGDDSLTTLLMHSSGEWLTSTTSLPRGADDKQLGSAITYRRRYAQVAILNLVSDDDNDVGEPDDDEGGPKTEAEIEYISVEQMEELDGLIGTKALLNKVLKAYGIDTLRNLQSADFEDCRNKLLTRNPNRGAKNAEDL